MMMDLDESLRALYFAPIAIVVLDHNRTIKMINGPAESLLSVGGLTCAGHRLERYLAPDSRASYALALNEAQESISKAITGVAAPPVLTRLQLFPAEGLQGSLWGDFSVSAWHPNDTIFGAGEASKGLLRRYSSEASTTSSNQASAESSLRSPTLYSTMSPPPGSSNLSSTSHIRLPHEALFTITIWPSKEASFTERRSTQGRRELTEALEDSVFQDLDIAVLALSKDGKSVVQNKACRERFPLFSASTSRLSEWSEFSSGTRTRGTTERVMNMSVLSDAMVCYDENFQAPMAQSDWPFYKSAALGQVAHPIVVGVESKQTRERALIQISGKAVRDNGGYGEHIGGIFTIQNITAERAKLKLEAEAHSDRFFKQTCDALPQMVWIASATGYVEWFSRTWYNYTGGNAQDSKGVGWTAFVHEDDGPEASRRWSHALRTGTLYEVGYRLKRSDGVWRWFLGRALPLFDEKTGEPTSWFGTCTDIHDQVEALATSRRAQSQLESVINHAAITLWAVDREGKITIAEGPGIRQLKLIASGSSSSEKDAINRVISPQAQHLSQTQQIAQQSAMRDSSSNGDSNSSKKSMIGRSIYQVWDRTDIQESMSKALNGETVVEEMEVDGRWFRTSYTPLRAQPDKLYALKGSASGDRGGSYDTGDDTEASEGEIVGVVGASMDITDRKKAQEKMEESLLEKTRALAAEGAARDASRMKSEFLANMSHEIRTPIAGVIGLSELLLEESGLTSKHRDYIETIQRSAEGLLTVINDVLDFSKVEIGKLEVEQAPFNLEVVLRDAKRMLSFATQKKGLEFRESVELGYKNQLVGDVGRLRQVITNLLTNAIKFTATGFISLEATKLEEDAHNLLIRVDVRDSGCGISPETLSKLFQPFSQADPSTARRFGGTGLGLSISKRLVELMHGTIALESVEGQGSHAWFVIPFRKATAMEEGMVRSKLLEASTNANTLPSGDLSTLGGLPIHDKARMSRPRKDIWILIAEDNLVNAQIASKNIQKMGFSCRTAENGIAALEELYKRNYDAVLMDCQMPQCDGYEATRLIRKSSNPDIRSLPVIALTASAIKGDRERALESGMVDYLAKPVKRAALEATLCRWLYDTDARQMLSAFFTSANVTEMEDVRNTDDIMMEEAAVATSAA